MGRSFRMMLQSGVLAVGAYLVINQQATAGVIIASSILSARALAPVDLAISHWRSFVGARQARERLNKLLVLLPETLARGVGFGLPALVNVVSSRYFELATLSKLSATSKPP